MVCTPNCGSVVEDGQDGFIVEAGSADKICEALSMLNDDRALLEFMSSNATRKSREYSYDNYAKRLRDVLRGFENFFLV